MEPIAGLNLIKPAHAGNKIGQGGGLLLLQVAEAIHGLLLGVVKGYVKTLTLPMIHPCDQHFLHQDHDVGLPDDTLVEQLPAPAFMTVVNLLPVPPDGT